MNRVKSYTADYIAKAVEHCCSAEKPIAAVARDLGIAYETLYLWMKKAGRTGKRKAIARPMPQTQEAMRAEIEQLRRELDEARKERDFAKKAAAFFAQQNK
jgi:transposase